MGRALEGCAFYFCFRLKVCSENFTLALFISSSTDISSPSVKSTKETPPIRPRKRRSAKPSTMKRRDSATDRALIFSYKSSALTAT